MLGTEVDETDRAARRVEVEARVRERNDMLES